MLSDFKGSSKLLLKYGRGKLVGLVPARVKRLAVRLAARTVWRSILTPMHEGGEGEGERGLSPCGGCLFPHGQGRGSLVFPVLTPHFNFFRGLLQISPGILPFIRLWPGF